MSTEPYICNLDPETKTKLKVFLFKNVRNVEEVRQGIVSGSLSCAAVKPALVVHPLQLAAAANAAALAGARRRLITRTVYSEILYYLSITKNISQSLSKFGVEKETELLVCILCSDCEQDSDIISHIQGNLCPISELPSFTDFDELKKVYKLSNLKDGSDYLDAIISRMVTKSIVSH